MPQAATSRQAAPGATSRADRTFMVYAPPELLRRLRIQAAHEDRTMSAVVVAAVEAYLDAHPVTALEGGRRAPSRARRSG